MATQNVDMMALFPEIDKKATIKKVNHFLKVTLPRMVRMAGHSMTDLQSPKLDGMPKSKPSSNVAETTITRHLVAEQVVQQTLQAVSHCSQISQQILKPLYLSGSRYYDYQVRDKIGYQETQYYYYKNKALLSFADAYLLDDLHVYK